MHKHVSDRLTQTDGFPIPEEIYPMIDNDLARDNIENDIAMNSLSAQGS